MYIFIDFSANFNDLFLNFVKEYKNALMLPI